MANSSMLARPSKTQPAAFSLPVTKESYGETNPFRIFEAQEHCSSFVQMLSFRVIGMPSNSPSGAPAARRASEAAACASTDSGFTARRARTFGSTA